MDQLVGHFTAFAAQPVLVRAALLLQFGQHWFQQELSSYRVYVPGGGAVRMAHVTAYSFEHARPQRVAFSKLDRHGPTQGTAPHSPSQHPAARGRSAAGSPWKIWKPSMKTAAPRIELGAALGFGCLCRSRVATERVVPRHADARDAGKCIQRCGCGRRRPGSVVRPSWKIVHD